MRYITKEMLLDAVERKVPLFEDGDEFGDDVLLYMIAGDAIDVSKKKYKHRKVLLQNVSSTTNKYSHHTLTWVTKCNCCGKEMRIPVSKSVLSTQRNTAIWIALRPADRECIATEYNGKKIRAKYLGCLILAGHRDHCFCHDCESKLKEELIEDLNNYCRREDKIAYWREQIAQYGTPDYLDRDYKKYCHRSLIDYEHPYRHFCGNMIFGGDNKELVGLYDSITGNDYSKRGVNDICVAEPHKQIYYLPKVQPVQVKPKQPSIRTVRYKTSPVVSEQPQFSATDMFIQKYCLQSRRNATIDDTREILAAEGLNEPQLRAHLQAMFYTDFVKTIYWKAIVLRRKWMDSLVCCRCGTKNNLEVHHLTYDHHGDERHHFEDLTTLCRKCHADIHAQENITRPK